MQQQASGHRKVLMVTYVFPPAAWVGVHRTLKYCKYLGDHGWTPVVLTARTSGVSFTDDKLLAQVPGNVAIHRTFDFDPAKVEAKLAQRKLRRLNEKGEAAPPGGDAAAAQSATGEGPPSFWKRARTLLKSLLKDSPDSHLFWVPFAFARGVLILLRHDIDVIYSTSPPHSTHFVTYLLAKCFRKPYVLDFRDPWNVIGSAGAPAPKIPWVLRLETRAKRAIVRGAAHIISVSKGERDELRAEFPDVDPGKFTTITNGYDPDDFTVTGDIERSDKLTLIHAGTIYPGIAGEFFEALTRLIRLWPDAARSMEVRLVGEIDYQYMDVARSLEAAGIVRICGMKPHAQTLRLVKGSDVLLILMGGNYFGASHLPSKMFEYLHAAKPILAIARDGELTEIARHSGLGIVVSPENVAGIVEALRDICREHAAGVFKREPDRAYISAFERASLAAQLSEVLHGVGSSKGEHA